MYYIIAPFVNGHRLEDSVTSLDITGAIAVTNSDTTSDEIDYMHRAL